MSTIKQPDVKKVANTVTVKAVLQTKPPEAKPQEKQGFFNKIKSYIPIENPFNKQAPSNTIKVVAQPSSTAKTTIQSEVTTQRVLTEAENEVEKKQTEQELYQKLFKSREIDLKGGSQLSKQALGEKLDIDIFEIKYKDNNGRTILHKAALEQRPETLRETFAHMEQFTDTLRYKIIHEVDNYGNTPLGLACVYDQESKRSNRLEVVKFLLYQKANPNVHNPSSLWTPLHWAARYGDVQVLECLLKAGAKAFVPDKKGYYPIDYAGFFKHVEAVKLLIKHTLIEADKLRRHADGVIWENGLNLFVDQSGKPGFRYTLFESPILQFNPLFHTTILYWASMFDQVDCTIVEEILNKLEAYPEGPVAIHYWRTPCHAASSIGNGQKLKILISEINQRYRKASLAGQGQASGSYQKFNICPQFKIRWNTLIKQERYTKVRKFYTTVFEPKLESYRLLKPFTFDFEDQFANSPLHLASQNGKDTCAMILIEEYKCKLDNRNTEGYTPKDLQQHEKIKIVYQNFYRKLDIMLSQSVVGLAKHTPVDIESQKAVLVQKSEKESLDKDLLLCREWMPKVPMLALKVNIKESAVVNRMIAVLKNSGFTVQMFPSLDQNLYFIALELKQKRMEIEAQNIGLKMKLVDVDAKRVFDPQSKEKFEPFRSKDIQTIMVSVIERLINTQQLINQKILISIIPLHDFSGIYVMRKVWENKSRCIPAPFALIKQFYKEGIHLKFTELSSIKNYFGEKIGFHFVWMSFYTTWLLIPGGCGLILTIYQLIVGMDTSFTVLYAILVCLWVTIFMERWKRKASEVSIKWGIFDFESKKQRQIRSEYNGDEVFSHVTHEVDRKKRSQKGLIVFILSLPVLTIMVGMCMGVFFATRYYKDSKITEGRPMHNYLISISAGFINGFAISVINFCYQRLARLFVNMENLKYPDNHETSFIYKLFIFKFVNTHFSLIYTAFTERENYEQLYALLIGMIIQKSIMVLFYKGPYKYMFFWLKKRAYFKKLHQLAQQQQIQHKNFLLELDQSQQDTMRQTIATVRNKPIFKVMNETTNIPYQRIVFNTTKNQDDQQLLIDSVELNGMMNPKLDLFEISEVSEIFIIFSLATLYSAVCPIVAFIVMIHNIFDMRFDLMMQYLAIRRPLQQTREGLGPWLQIAQFLSITAVVSNCLLLYLASPRLKSYINDTLQIRNDVAVIFIILSIEHIIIIIKFLCQTIIKDRPSWVDKHFMKIEHELDSFQIEESERKEKKEENEKMEILRTTLNEFKEKNQQMLSRMKVKVKEMKDNLKSKDDQLMKYTAGRSPGTSNNTSLENSPAISRKGTLQKIKEEQQALVKKGEPMLTDFLGLSSGEWLGDKRAKELEKALCRNLQLRLFKLTYNQIEKEILSRRIARIYDTKGQILINCVECSAKQAIIECTDCQDHFCKACSESIHSTSQLFSMHNQIQIPMEPAKQVSLFGSDQKQPMQPKMQNFFSQKVAQQVPQWKKFEYYNFPLSPGNDLYNLIQKHFAYLRQSYIENNYIDGLDKIDYMSLFVNEQYDLLIGKQAAILKAKNQKKFNYNKSQGPVTQFNDEELFYMNRVAFYLYKHKGEHLTFANFTSRLEILQQGDFNKRCTLWLSLLDESDDDQVSREQIGSIMRVVFAQDVNQTLKDEDIVNFIFGKDKQLPISQILEAINKNENVKAFIRCILQCSA